MKKILITLLVNLLSISIGASENMSANKIVSLDLCSDWMLAKYADRSQVLALSPLVHQYPVDWLGQDWPTHNGDLESILNLQPDLVITGEYNALLLRQRLQDLGVRVEVLSLPKTVDQIVGYERHFLRLLGQSTRTTIQHHQLADLIIDAPRLLLLGANGIGTGHNTFEHGIIERAGWRNYIDDDGYVNLDMERIVNDPPDALLLSSSNAAAQANNFAKHPVLKKIIASDRWLSVDHWRWQCPGPWTWGLIEQLKQ